MIDKYGEEVLRELEEEKQNKEEKEAADPDIQNVNQTVAFFFLFDIKAKISCGFVN